MTGFRDLYKSTFHKYDDIPSSFKFNYLVSYLEGDALDKIKNKPICKENYSSAWKALLDYYENKRRLIYLSISNLLAIESMKPESYAELRRLSSSSFEVLSSLESVDRPLEKGGSDLFLYVMVLKFDPTTRKDWENLLGNSQDPASIQELKKFVDTQLAVLESIRNTQPVVNSSTSKPSNSVKSHATVTPKENNDKSWVCPMCSENHPLYHCPNFRGKSAQERNNFVTGEGLCSLCLNPHATTACDSRLRCRFKMSSKTCNRRHNTLLHLKNFSPEAKI